MPFDKEQQLAVDAVNTNILVSASAGAGKTGVLVGRLTKRVVEDKIRISRVLALTFTQAAAAEMKSRLAASFQKIIRETDDAQLKEWVLSQNIELESANITTIDSFCLTLIKKYYTLIGLDPDTVNHILNNASDSRMEQDAFYEALEELLKEDHDTAFSLLTYFSARAEDYAALQGIVHTINSHAQSSINPDEWYAKAAESYHPIRRLTDLDEEVLDAFFAGMALELESALSDLNLMEKLSLDDEKVKPDTLRAKRNAVMNCLQAVQEHNYSSYCLAIDEAFLCKTSASTHNKAYTAIRGRMNDTLKGLVEKRYDEKLLIQDHNSLHDLVYELVNLSRNSWQLFMKKKQDEAVMDFADMERYAWEILNVNHGAAADILRDSFDEIMVDEFQDTSFLQNAIIEKISNGHNIFRVGDVKQSIYRFRQAKPELMRSLMHDPDTLQIQLKHNFRSQKSIVAFTNALFQKVMNIPGCKDTYGTADTVSIGSQRQEEELVPVVFAAVAEKEGTRMNATEKRRLKAEWIAGRILRMVQEDPEHYRFSSFCILVRSHNEKPMLKRVFDTYNIPYNIDAREGFYASPLCQIILAMCRLMLNPDDAVSLTAVLTSPMYGFSDNDLAALKSGHSSLIKGVREEFPKVYEDMAGFRRIAEHDGITDMLSAIADAFDFYNQLDASQKANYDFLFETASSTKYDSLYTFVRDMEDGEDEKSSQAQSCAKDDDVVTVTTIHQSKGLQYPVVFLWGTSKTKFNESTEQIIVNDELKAAVNHIDLPYREKRTTILKEAVSYRNNLEDLEEFTRLLYVAVTRAEKKLFLIDTFDIGFIPQGNTLSYISTRPGLTGLMVNAMLEDPLFEIEIVENEQILPHAKPMETYVEKLPALTVKPHIQESIRTPSSLEMKEPAMPDLSADLVKGGTSYGTRMHEAAESLPLKAWTMEDMKELDLRVSDKQKLIAFSQSDIYQKALTMEIHKEMPFYVICDREHLTGAIDFLAVNDTEVLLIDYKTDHASMEEIHSRYQSQINAYKKALKQIYPDRKISAYAWSFYNNDKISM